jgi:hypothetical protein
LIWIDTLCVPVGPNEEHLRRAQIDDMASIYRGALYSLVLDAELMASVNIAKPFIDKEHVRDRHFSWYIEDDFGIEGRARLACSIWMTRGWTLQEGRLPDRIAVQFQNSTVILRCNPGMYLRGFLPKGLSRMLPDCLTRSPFTIYTVTNHIKGLSTNASDTCAHAPDEPTMYGSLTSSDEEQAHIASLSGCKRCRSVERALLRQFTTTFCTNHVQSIYVRDLIGDFIFFWGELAGRSTTMDEDVPSIMANSLELIGLGSQDLIDAGHMYQTILISMGQIPLAIFFNTGPRQHQHAHHQNRWVPTRLSNASLLATPKLNPPLFDVGWSDLEFQRCSCELANHEDIVLYTTKVVLPFCAQTYVSLGNPEDVYVVEPSVSTSDCFRSEAFSFTCLIVERNAGSHQLRGACFYAEDSAQFDRMSIADLHDHLLGFSIVHVLQNLDFPAFARSLRHLSMKWLIWDVTFCCPLRLRRAAANELMALDPTTLHALECAGNPYKLRVRYGVYSPIMDEECLLMHKQIHY